MDATTLTEVAAMMPESTAAYVDLVRFLLRDAVGLPAHQVENETDERGREVLRLAFQSFLDARSRESQVLGEAIVAASLPAGETEAVPERPVLLSHRRERQRTYKSVFGMVHVDRVAFGAPGQTSLVPLDEALSLPKRRTGYPVQKSICTEVARGPYEEATRVLARQGIQVSPAGVDDIAQDAAIDFEAYYKTTQVGSPEETSSILVAAVDCKGVVIRKTPDEVERIGRKQMATVAAVYTIAPYIRTPEEVIREVAPGRLLKVLARRPRPESKRIWASLERSKDDVLDEVIAEMRGRDPDHTKIWIAVIDGERALQDRALDRNLLLILDLFHVMERLWDMAKIFEGDNEDAIREWVTDHLLRILRGEVSLVVRGIRQAATKRELAGEARRDINRATEYFLNNKDFMRYDRYLAAGLPIGSGAAEGACRHLIKDRLERTGMQWTREGAEAVIKLRALEISGDTDAYWTFHIQQEHQRLYTSRPWTPPAQDAA